MARILELTLNGRPAATQCHDNVLLLDYLREIVGLTGTKTGCDGGECGACTVLVDDQPRLVVPDACSNGRRPRVDTVESLGDGRAAVRRAARVPRKARLAMRLLHAGIHHGFGRTAAAQSAARAKTRSARRSAATSAAAPGYVKIIEAVTYAAELHAAGAPP